MPAERGLESPRGASALATGAAWPRSRDPSHQVTHPSRPWQFSAASGQMSGTYSQEPPGGIRGQAGECAPVSVHRLDESSEHWEDSASPWPSLQRSPVPSLSTEPGAAPGRFVPKPSTLDPYEHDRRFLPHAECAHGRDCMPGQSTSSFSSSLSGASPSVHGFPSDSRSCFPSVSPCTAQIPPEAAAASPLHASGLSLGSASVSSPLLSRLLLSILTSQSDATRVAALLKLEALAVDLLADTRRLHMTLTVLDAVLCNAVPVAVVALSPNVPDPSEPSPRELRDRLPAASPLVFPEASSGARGSAAMPRPAAPGTAAPFPQSPPTVPSLSGTDTEARLLHRSSLEQTDPFSQSGSHGPSDGAGASHEEPSPPGLARSSPAHRVRSGTTKSRVGSATGRNLSPVKAPLGFRRDAGVDADPQSVYCDGPAVHFTAPGAVPDSRRSPGERGLAAGSGREFACEKTDDRASDPNRNLDKCLAGFSTDELSAVVQIDLSTESPFLDGADPVGPDARESGGDDVHSARLAFEAEARNTSRPRASLHDRLLFQDQSAEGESWRRDGHLRERRGDQTDAEGEEGEADARQGYEASGSCFQTRAAAGGRGAGMPSRVSSPARSSHVNSTFRGAAHGQRTRQHQGTPSTYAPGAASLTCLDPAVGGSLPSSGVEPETHIDVMSRQVDSSRTLHPPQPPPEDTSRHSASGALQRERLSRSFANAPGPAASSLRGGSGAKTGKSPAWPTQHPRQDTGHSCETLPTFCPRPSLVVGQPFSAVARLVCMQVYTAICVCLDLVLIAPEWVERLMGLLHSILRRTSVHEDAVFRSYACDCLQELERNCPGLLSAFLGPDWFAGPGLVSTLSTTTLERVSASPKKSRPSPLLSSPAANARPLYLLDLLQTERQHVAEAYAGLLVTSARHATEMLVQEAATCLVETREEGLHDFVARAPRALHAAADAVSRTDDGPLDGLPPPSGAAAHAAVPQSNRAARPGDDGARAWPHACPPSPLSGRAQSPGALRPSRGGNAPSLRDQLWEPCPSVARPEQPRASNSRDRPRRRDVLRADADRCFRISLVGVSLLPLLPLEFPSSLGTLARSCLSGPAGSGWFSACAFGSPLGKSPVDAFAPSGPQRPCLPDTAWNAFASKGLAPEALSGPAAALAGLASLDPGTTCFPPPRLPRRFVTSLLRALAVVLDGFWWFGEWTQLHVVRNLVFFSRLLGLPPAVTVDPLLPLLYSDRPPLVHAFLRLVAEYPHSLNHVVVRLVHQKVRDLATNPSLKPHFRILALRWLLALFDLPLFAPLFFRSPPSFLYPSAGDSTAVKEHLLQLLLVYYHRRGRYLSAALQTPSRPAFAPSPLMLSRNVSPQISASPASLLSAGHAEPGLRGRENGRFEDRLPSMNPLPLQSCSRIRHSLSSVDLGNAGRPDLFSPAGAFECFPNATSARRHGQGGRSERPHTVDFDAFHRASERAAAAFAGLPENLLDVCEILQEFRYSTGPVGAHAVVYRFLLRLLQFPGQPLREKVHAFICEQLSPPPTLPISPSSRPLYTMSFLDVPPVSSRSQPTMLMASTLALMHHLSKCRSSASAPPPSSRDALEFDPGQRRWRSVVESQSAVAYSLLLSLGEFVKRLEPPSHIPQFFPLLLRLAIEPVVSPHMVLQALHRLVDVSARGPRGTPADDREQWEVGMKLLAICRQLLVTHSQARLYEGLSRLLLEFAETTPCIDLRDNAVLLLKVFTHAGRLPLKLLLSRGDQQMLPLMHRHLTCVFPSTYRIEGPLPFLTLEKSRRERREMCGLSDHQAAFFLSTAFYTPGEAEAVADVFVFFDENRGNSAWADCVPFFLEDVAASSASAERKFPTRRNRNYTVREETDARRRDALQMNGDPARVAETHVATCERSCFSAFQKFYATCYESDDKTITLLNTMHAHSGHHSEARVWRSAAFAAADKLSRPGRDEGHDGTNRDLCQSGRQSTRSGFLARLQRICASSPVIVPPAAEAASELDNVSPSPNGSLSTSLLSSQAATGEHQPSRAALSSGSLAGHARLSPSPSFSPFLGSSWFVVDLYRAFVTATPFFIRIPFCLRFKSPRDCRKGQPVRYLSRGASSSSPNSSRPQNTSFATSARGSVPPAAARDRSEPWENEAAGGVSDEVDGPFEGRGLAGTRADGRAVQKNAGDQRQLGGSGFLVHRLDARRADHRSASQGMLTEEAASIPDSGPGAHGHRVALADVDLPLLTELYGIELIFSHSEDYAPMRSVRLPFLQDASVLAKARDSDGTRRVRREVAEVDEDEEGRDQGFPFMYKIVLKLQPQQPVPASIAVDVRFSDAAGALFYGQLETFSVSFQDLFLPILEFDRDTVQDMIEMTLRPFLVEDHVSDDSEDFDFEQV
ncbi:conserved hypothetical protein [Neospora caninum Liverpool]|uniref:Uncharacterized protein n=1 Tax=Neospora caninum (strain Liverpool) TaxID=572307 RepID=F0VA14_NEOCL|nr:conserved hypothetical protein [Neospora caninum Liverpool]CBZ50503.1 conserved hypothetical protein [Neospora caninum Liverpool]|eukprot:XP_003880536.1 conserved hypothetical protein [Neospora caninum Liverpool]